MKITTRRIVLLAFALCSFFVGAWATAPVGSRLVEAPGAHGQADPQDPTAAGPMLRFPSPSLTPEDVVGVQLAALRAAHSDPDAWEQCFAFASPANRAVTGPLPRFASMASSPPYDALVRQEAHLVGRATIQGNSATLVATVIGPNQEAAAFRFLLTRQTDQPVAGCWMTDAVWRDPFTGESAGPSLPDPAA